MLNRITKIILCTIGTFILLIIIPFAVLIFSDWLGGTKLENQLINSIPKKTEFIKAHTTTQQFSGSGNRTDFLSVIIVKRELSKEELRNYYSYYKFDYAKPYSRHMFENENYFVEHEILVQIEKVNSLPIETSFSDGNDDGLFFGDLKLDNFDNIYFIAVSDPLYNFWALF